MTELNETYAPTSLPKRLVCRTADMVGIFGVMETEGLPPPMIDSPLGPICLVTTKSRYHLYQPVVVPDEDALTTDFNDDQI